MDTPSKQADLTGVVIHIDDLSDRRIAAFLEDHLKDMHAHSPPESVHALDLTELQQPEITFWSAWLADEVVGCVALKQLTAKHVELKSMRTAPQLRGQGLGRFMLQFVQAEARKRGYLRMSLETGAAPFFTPAWALYAAHGFVRCEPFDHYWADPNRVFMTREL